MCPASQNDFLKDILQTKGGDFMNRLLKTISDLRKNKDLHIDTSNSDRYRIVVNEADGTKTAYYFSAPIYNINSKKLVDLKFTDSATPRLIGSNAQITFSNSIKMNNSNGNCFIALNNHIDRVSDHELHEGENIILPTTNGFVYKVPVENDLKRSIILKTDRGVFTTRANNKYFALMIDKFTPFVYISAIGIEDSNGYINSPFTVTNRKISEYEYEISASTNTGVGKYLVFEINMYEKKLIQDTTVESYNPKVNNAFGSSAYIGHSSEFGEQWLYSRIDYMRLSDISGCRAKNATAYIPKLSNNDLDVVAYKVSERFCSFGSNWNNKKSESNYVNRSGSTDRYVVIDITSALIHEKSKQVIATNGLILKPAKKNDFVSITTGDSCFLPQILAINYY